MANWSVTVGRWKKVPIRLHASLPIGLLFFTGFRFEPFVWLAFIGLILIHELGHAWVVRTVGGRATEVMIHGFGGHCGWLGQVTPLGRAAIACGGVAAQLIILFVALALWRAGHRHDVLWVAIFSNAWMIGFNLIPVSPLDGGEAWAFPHRLGARLRQRLKDRQSFIAAQTPGHTTEAHAKALASKILEDARKDEP